jgi:hypothetical protein
MEIASYHKISNSVYLSKDMYVCGLCPRSNASQKSLKKHEKVNLDPNRHVFKCSFTGCKIILKRRSNSELYKTFT